MIDIKKLREKAQEPESLILTKESVLELLDRLEGAIEENNDLRRRVNFLERDVDIMSSFYRKLGE